MSVEIESILLPANHTDNVQPIDAGFGYIMKSKIGDVMESPSG